MRNLIVKLYDLLSKIEQLYQLKTINLMIQNFIVAAPHPFFYNFVWAWTILGVIVFLVNLQIKAPYGRHTNNSWGKKMIDNRLGWILMELPALLTAPIMFLAGTGEKSLVSYIFIGLWLLHYINRTLIFPFRLRTKGKKMPLAIILSAVLFNLTNGFVCGYFLGSYGVYDESWLYSVPFILGVLLFFTGFIINNYSDHLLINLRKPGETGYKIPKGGLFKYISCPNHFGEIIEWGGFALATFALPTLSFFLWTSFNLIPRALAHHKWYKNKFKDYPKERRAIFPKWV